MLILTPAARDRIAAAVSQSLQAPVIVVTPAGARQCTIEIGEAPLIESTPDGLRLGVWINIAPVIAEELTIAAAVGAKYAGAWDGVTPVDGQRFENAPCYLCGYRGAGYFQADTHSCAAGYHAAVARLSRVEQA